MTRDVLATEMWAPFHFGNPNQRYADFLAIARPRLHRFIESILLHDRIVVPTNDFLAATILVGCLGADATQELIERDVLRFVRVKGALCYIGNGGGLRVINKISSKEGEPQPPWAPLDEAISWALRGLNDNSFDKDTLAKSILKQTREIDLSPLEDEIRHESYTEIQNSRTLVDWFALRNIELDRLAGIEPDGFRIFEGYEAQSHDPSEIATVLRLAQINLELRIAGLMQTDDLVTAAPITDHLDFKLEQLNPSGSHTTASNFFEIVGVPNIGEAVLTKATTVAALAKVRDTNDGKAFRRWFHENASGDTKEIARAYIEVLNKVPAVQTTAGKTVRWVVSSGIGMIPIVGNVLGPIIGAVDTFLVDKFEKPSPKFFVEKLTKLLPPVRPR